MQQVPVNVRNVPVNFPTFTSGNLSGQEIAMLLTLYMLKWCIGDATVFQFPLVKLVEIL